MVSPNRVDLVTAVVGFALLLYGLARLSVSAALITGGVLLLAGALWRGGTQSE